MYRQSVTSAAASMKDRQRVVTKRQHIPMANHFGKEKQILERLDELQHSLADAHSSSARRSVQEDLLLKIKSDFRVLWTRQQSMGGGRQSFPANNDFTLSPDRVKRVTWQAELEKKKKRRIIDMEQRHTEKMREIEKLRHAEELKLKKEAIHRAEKLRSEREAMEEHRRVLAQKQAALGGAEDKHH